ncbi:hypothetical protein C3L33_21961, partial [Rhododendron williamsianum]
CAAGKVCGHYTQVVWRNSVRLGCARVRCNDGLWFITCNYDPPGNYVGQRPYNITSHGQNSPEDYLNAHNSARSAVGVGPMTWDVNVEAFAQQYANQRVGDCALQHSEGGGQDGENLAKGSGDFTGAAAVGLWVGEKPDYDYNSNTCAAGKVCGHYTQVVWENSVRLGCARQYANQRARDCALQHSGGGGKYGKNIAVGSGDFTRAAAVGLWVRERLDYNYNSNMCAAGWVCGHYTQVLWRNTVRLGCARVR